MSEWRVLCRFIPRVDRGKKYGLKTGSYEVVCSRPAIRPKLILIFNIGNVVWIPSTKRYIRNSMINPRKELNEVLTKRKTACTSC